MSGRLERSRAKPWPGDPPDSSGADSDGHPESGMLLPQLLGIAAEQPILRSGDSHAFSSPPALYAPKGDRPNEFRFVDQGLISSAVGTLGLETTSTNERQRIQ